MKKLYIIKTGTTFKDTAQQLGDFDRWIIDTIGKTNLDIAIIDIQKEEPLPNPDKCLGIIVSGSHAMVTQELPWSVKIEKWIPSIIENNIPFLGICYGHQLLAKSMQGTSDYHPNGLEMGTVTIALNEHTKNDAIFKNLPTHFDVHTIHSQTVLQLPTNAIALAFNTHDKHHAYRIGECAWGVQFHPEYNTSIMKSYIKEVCKKEKISNDEFNRLCDGVKDTPYSAKILENFASFIREKMLIE